MPSERFGLGALAAAQGQTFRDVLVRFARYATLVNDLLECRLEEASGLARFVARLHSGPIAWAMNVGGAGELGFPPHRRQMHPDRIAELEELYPRSEFRREAMRLVREEARRVPGRFAFFRWIFPLILRA